MKKLLALLLAMGLAVTLVAACAPDAPEPAPEPAAEEPAPEPEPEPEPADENEAANDADADRPFRVGVTIQSLANPYWAGVFAEADRLMTERGWDFTIVDCDDNSAIQISQIENFIVAEKDLIMVHPSDPFAVEDVLAQAMAAGILVMSWDDKLENSDVNWVLDNEELGRAIGTAAAEFINEHYTADNPAQVAIMNYPQVPILLDRENGIIAALEEIAEDRFVIVAQQPAIEAGPAQSHMETILQAHPDVRVVASIGAGGDIGANEAFMVATGGDIPDDMGIFSADATEQQLNSILNGEASRVTVGFEGSRIRTALALIEVFEALLYGEPLARDIYRPLLPMDASNAAEFLADYE